MFDNPGAAIRQVDASVARSWLLVNGTRKTTFDQSLDSAADQIVVDLEDAVDPKDKPTARLDVAAWLERRPAWVRINDRTTPFWADDLDLLAGLPGLQGVMLAKTEQAEHVTETFDRLGGKTPVLALVESAIGIEAATAIARARGIFRLAFGSGDYCRDTGAGGDDLSMAYPRSRLVVASRIGQLPGPIDGPTVGGVHSALQERSATAVSMGMTGKLCLETGQAGTVNAEFSPSASDVAWAREFLTEFDARGRTIRDGSDRPRLVRAAKITELAEAFRIGVE
ncbi:HpcH/HpaI aldolase/citrate lyase family protein [Rhodococcus sp. NPDC056960]|uniref:HpcH/HpaI aldolase/citrate lyase family protein n=1 Tax=Rhodococcus sp. NPDC056960 TaxID=3345982 RepID=UPI00362CA894